MKAKSNVILNTMVMFSMLFGLIVTPALANSRELKAATPAESAVPAQAPDGVNIDISEPVTPDISPALRDLPLSTGKETKQGEINRPRGEPQTRGTDTHIQDPLAANGLNSGHTPDPLFTFEGTGNLNIYTPPDTTGDVGPNHYIQLVNVKMAIYNKSGGLLYGPVDINTLWSGFGGPCQTENDGDPIVLYDDMADRWFITQFAPFGTPPLQCVAVSTTPDPLGTYYRYAFSMPDFPDYPKFGVWPDGYYFGTNTGYPNQYYAHVLDRVSMLNGNPATRISFGGYANLLMPADVDGKLPPPEGTPEYFYTYFSNGYPDHPPGVDRLAIYEFHVDWANPGNSTFTLVTELPIAPYNYTVCGFFVQNCIPEPSPGVPLDSLSWWPMVRLQYRNFGLYEAMVSNFTVDLDGTNKAAIRWFELRKAAANPWSLFQEGTYTPDASHRWMGSIAMDGSGNIALGYSVSDATSTKPSIRYAVHGINDPPGTMQSEAVIINGTGVNTGPYNRWGDYSAMNVDPVDQCTFWYTNEYHDVNENSFMWNTRVGVFKVPSCSGSLGPTGTLDGHVSDSVSGDPIVGASIAASLSITQTFNTSTDLSGYYQMDVPVGTYDVTGSAFGHLPETVSGVVVISGTVTTQDIALDPAPAWRVYGYITDANTGSPLYASYDIAGVPGGPFWNDPVTGYYEISLPVGGTYDFSVNAWVSGYQEGTQTVGPLTGDIQVDFALDADLAACTAPGYDFAPYKENFEANDGGFTIFGTGTWEWGVPTSGPGAAHSGTQVWATNLEGVYDNNENSYIESSNIDLSSLVGNPVNIAWWQYLQSESNYDKAEVRVSKNGGASWTTVYGPVSGPVDLKWARHVVTLDSSYAVSNFRVSFRFTSDRSVTYNGWYIDDLSAGTCSPPADGGLVVGNVYDANTLAPLNGANVTNASGYGATTQSTPLDPAVDDGFYTIFSPSGTQSHTGSMTGGYAPSTVDVDVVEGGTVGQDFNLDAGWLTYAPSSLHATLGMGGSQVQKLTLTNQGGAPLSFELIGVGQGMVPAGTIETPGYGVVRPRRQQYKTTEGIGVPRPVPPADPFPGGEVVKSWQTSDKGSPWGVAYDSKAGTVWVGDGWGSNQIFEYGTDGTPTERSYPHTWNPTYGPADIAYNWNTGKLWLLDVGNDNCIHEIDPTSGVTGATICPDFEFSQRGLAYDPATDTYFAGGWNDGMVYRFDSSGTILEAVNTALDISGLAYNPDTHHLFVMVNTSPNPVYVLDVADGYAVIGKFSVSQGFGDYAGAGLEFDCAGYLWAVDQSTFTVYQFESGETTSLCAMDAPWLSVDPVTGTIPANSVAEINVNFDASAVTQLGDYFAQLMIENDTPYLVSNLPVTMTVVTPTYLEVGHLAPFAVDPGTAVTVTLNGEPALTDFQYGDSTGYLVLPEGTYDVAVWPAGSTSPAITGTVTLLPNTYYTAIAIGDGVNQDLGLKVLTDDLTAPAAGKFHLRLGHLAPFASGDALADIRLQDGTPVITDVAFSDVTAFIPLDAGEYDLKVTTPGGAITLIDPLPVTFNAGDIVSAFATGDGSNQPLGVFAWPAGVEGFFLPLTAYGVELSPSEAAQSGAPGETVTYTLTVTNTGDITETFGITFTAGWDVHLPVPELTLGAGASTEFVVHVDIPADAADGDSDVATVTVMVEGVPSAKAEVELTTTARLGKVFLPLVMDGYNAP